MHLGRRLIFPNDSFDIGRKDVQNAWAIDAPTVSTHHLRIRCVMYEDDEDHPQVSPMLYACVLSANSVHFTTHTADNPDCTYARSRADGDILLGHGDVLHIAPDVSLLFQADKRYAAVCQGLTDVQHVEVSCFRSQYLVSDRKLGVGGQASVFVAVKQSSGQQVACKILRAPDSCQSIAKRLQQERGLPLEQLQAELKNIRGRQLEKRTYLAREYAILKTLNHPNIIALQKVICATYNIYIFQ